MSNVSKTVNLDDIEKYTGILFNDLWSGIESLISSLEYTDCENYSYIVREISNTLRYGYIDDISIRENIPYLVSKLREIVKRKKSFKPLEDVFNLLINHGNLTCDQVNECLEDCDMDYRVEYGAMGNIMLYKLEVEETGDTVSDEDDGTNTSYNKEKKSMKEIFIGSSTRGVMHAEALKGHLESEPALKGIALKCKLWKDEDMFELSKATIENLMDIAEEIYQSHGYAILLFTPDDLIYLDGPKQIVGKKYIVPRDNVIFEFGLFMGKLDRNHTFCVCPKEKNRKGIRLRLPSDLQGVTYAEYTHKWKFQNNINTNMEEPARKIAAAIAKGIDYSVSSENL